MQTVVRTTDQLDIQSVIIKFHDEKPTHTCKEYKEVYEILNGCELQRIEEEERKNLIQNDFKEYGANNADQFLKQQM